MIYPNARKEICPRCGEPGYHANMDVCIEILKEAIARWHRTTEQRELDIPPAEEQKTLPTIPIRICVMMRRRNGTLCAKEVGRSLSVADALNWVKRRIPRIVAGRYFIDSPKQPARAPHIYIRNLGNGKLRIVA